MFNVPQKSKEERLRIMRAGSAAREYQAHTDNASFDQEWEIVASAIGLYRAGTLDPQLAFGAIAEISALRMLQERLEVKVQQGYSAADQEMSDGEEASGEESLG